MRLPPPDPLSTILLYVGAIAMAATAATAALAPGTPIVKQVPALTMSGIWPYVPITLMSVAAVIWIARGLKGGPPSAGAEGSVGSAPAPYREPFLTPYLKTYVVIMTCMIVSSLAFTIISHLFPSGK